jgi:hypothetical protein
MSSSHSQATSSATAADGLRRAATAILIPDRRQPVGSDRRVQTAADDEPEVPGTLRPDKAGIRRRDQLLDHFQRWSRPVLEGNPQRRAQLLKRRARANGSFGEGRHIVGRDLSRPTEQFGIHPATLHVVEHGVPGRREAGTSGHDLPAHLAA